MWGLLAAFALVALNGFFVAAEFCMVRVRPARLERLARKGSGNAHAALQIASNLDRYLSVSQIGITLCSLALGWIGEPAVASILERSYHAMTGVWLTSGKLHAVGIGFAFSIITFLHVLIGEQVPKMIALQKSEVLALALARPFQLAFVLLTPVRLVLEGATLVVLRIAGVRGQIASEGKLSEEELFGVIAATLARGPGAEDKRQLLERVIRFASRQARHAMVPRVDVAHIPIHTRGEEAIAHLRSQEYSRVVLTEKDDLDRVVGYLYAKDLLLDPNASKLSDLASVRRDVLFVPEPQSLVDVLRAMQQAQTLFAIVVDEYGGTSGLLTMEDLLEEIVGEIRDEADEEAIPNVRELATHPGVYEVEADASLDELHGLGVEPDDAQAGDSVGAYVVRKLGRIPHRGDHVRLGPFDAEIRHMRRRRILRLRLYPRTPTIRPMPAALGTIDIADADGDSDNTLP